MRLGAGSDRHAGSACQSNYRHRGWGLGRPAKGGPTASHPRGAVRAEKRLGRRPGASREMELTAAHSLAGAGGWGASAACIPAAGAAAGTPAPAGPPRRPAPDAGDAEAEARAEVSKEPRETNTEAPADMPLIRAPQDGRITDLGIRLVAAGGNTPERK